MRLITSITGAAVIAAAIACAPAALAAPSGHGNAGELVMRLPALGNTSSEPEWFAPAAAMHSRQRPPRADLTVFCRPPRRPKRTHDAGGFHDGQCGRAVLAGAAQSFPCEESRHCMKTTYAYLASRPQSRRLGTSGVRSAKCSGLHQLSPERPTKEVNVHESAVCCQVRHSPSDCGGRRGDAVVTALARDRHRIGHPDDWNQRRRSLEADGERQGLHRERHHDRTRR